MPPPEKAIAFLEREGKATDGRAARPARDHRLARDASERGSSELAAEYGADEVIVVTITHDHGPAGAPTS